MMKWLSRIVQFLVPTWKSRIGYYSEPDYTDNAFYMYKYILMHRDNVTHVWIASDKDTARRIKRDFENYNCGGHTLVVLPRKSIYSFLYMLSCGTIFYSHTVYRYLKPTTARVLVNLWHGMPIKRIGVLDNARKLENIPYGSKFVASTVFFQYIISSVFKVDVRDVVLCAQPRCEVLKGNICPDISRDLVSSYFSAGNKKIVIWLPSFRDKYNSVHSPSFLDDLDEDMLNFLNFEAGMSNTIVIVKLHKNDSLNNDSRVWSYDNIVLLKSSEWEKAGMQLYDLVSLSDGIMSDVSSIIIDCLGTAKPIGLVGYDAESYQRGLLFPYRLVEDQRECYTLRDHESVTAYFQAVSSGEMAISPEDITRELLVNQSVDNGCEIILNAVKL
jgi:CDP-glycerol glycerophosphotransferase (TagB/SpsB family)